MEARFTRLWFVRAVVAGVLLLPPWARAAHTTSVSQQFIVSAPDPLVASAVCVLAERVKRAWLGRLKLADDWRDPIVILFRERTASESDAPSIRFDTIQTDAHLRYQIRCLMSPPLSESALVEAIIEALCAELANRAQPTSLATPYIVAPIPLWLVQGFLQSFQGRSDILVAVARRSVNAGRPLTAAQLLNVTMLPSDPAERELFRANAWMFTDGLLSVTDGPRKMQRFMADLGTTKSVAVAIDSAYGPDFAKEAALEKWWSVQQARRVATTVPRSLFAEETMRRLDEILLTMLVQTPAGDSGPVETQVALGQLWLHYEQPWLKPILMGKLNALEALRSHAHPMYREVIEAYITAINALLNQQLNRFQRAVRHAQHLRANADDRARQIRECLDAVEKSYVPEQERSALVSYVQTLENMQSVEQRRRSPISDYLDQFDR